MLDNKYNGWTNYETWNFNLWITNEEADYKYASEIANESTDRWELSKKLEEWAENMADEQLPDQCSFIADMVNSSIKEVNFYEVAEHLWEDKKGV